VEFYLSTEWANLKPNTQANYRNIYERFRADYGHNHGRGPDQEARAGHDGREGPPRPAPRGNFLKRLRGLLDFAWTATTATTTRPRRSRPPGWPLAASAPGRMRTSQKFTEHHPAGSRARLALLLLLYTGQRRSDVVTMGRQHVANGKIHVLQLKGKKGRRARAPGHPATP
jgi:integrase